MTTTWCNKPLDANGRAFYRDGGLHPKNPWDCEFCEIILRGQGRGYLAWIRSQLELIEAAVLAHERSGFCSPQYCACQEAREWRETRETRDRGRLPKYGF